MRSTRKPESKNIRGLMEFVKHYHSLTHLPIPVLEEVQLGPFLEKIVNLIEPECKKNGISIRVNGCGIDMDNVENVFIPYFTTREKGSGIGLSFAKQIMRLHNGKISVKSDVGKGAEFILRF